jgi:hypothetical protein
MTAAITFLLLTVLLLAGLFRMSAPLVGHLFEEGTGRDADKRRISHDLDAIRTRFEEHPVWPSSGVLGERR